MTSKLDSGALLDKARAATDNAVVGRVFGEPVERDGIILLPVAKVSAGAGSGSGSGKAPAGEKTAAEGEGEGSGGGYGLSAKPAGVFILKEGDVHWKPAVDINKIVLGGQVVAIVALLVARSVLRGHRRRRR
ncbi:spore germination protein GerW family protein [Actinoplanes awajinensis]|uniref:Sporulation protein n=1 Tax=Actinoplanes awajinensis subsp. mycoplanecinus TaxID=135947 RepID=A0A0X3URW5_9ACTN|nr:spore germination protein GerW family protein [Actinoplanes awajinensis]KUL35254.1 hypothetical protein ADL15_14625 [Actinoplanes awajinensis subsp. mycoplanecinus]